MYGKCMENLTKGTLLHKCTEILTKGTESFWNCAFFQIVNFWKNLQKVQNESFFRKFRKFTIRKNAQFQNDSVPFVRFSVHFPEKIFYRVYGPCFVFSNPSKLNLILIFCLFYF